jgi:hypothetical protein
MGHVRKRAALYDLDSVGEGSKSQIADVACRGSPPERQAMALMRHLPICGPFDVRSA